MKTLAAALAVLLCPGILSAQATHVVGPGGFAQIDQALAVAAPGDTVLVLPGTYSKFTLSIDVTIRAAAPGTVVVGSPFAFGFTIVDLSASASAALVDLEFLGLSITGGTVSLDGCTVRAPALSIGDALSVYQASVSLQACHLFGGSGFVSTAGHRAGLWAEQAVVTAIDSTFEGSDIGSPLNGPPAGAAIQLLDTTFQGSGLSVSGGDGSISGLYAAQPAVQATGSIVYISDSTLAGGAIAFGSGPPVACPLQVSAGRLSRCVLMPTCPAGIPTNGPLLGVHRPVPMQSPGTVELAFGTDANGLVGVFLADDISPYSIAGFEQRVWLDAPTLRPLALIVADAQGLANYTGPVPAGLGGLLFWFQAVAASDPLQLSPVAGGVVR